VINYAMLSFSFAAGVAVFFNPCGFPMLPPFIAAYLGKEEGKADNFFRSLLKGLKVGLANSAGFVLFFGIMGIILTYAGSTIAAYIPWVAGFIGVFLIIFGLLMAFKKDFNVSLPLDRFASLITRNRTKEGGITFFFLGGIGYAIVSLGCVFPAFLIVVTMAFGGGALNGVTQFLAYAVGMSLPMLALAILTACSSGFVYKHMHTIMTYIKKISGVIMVGAGIYVIWYQLFLSGILQDALGY